MAPLKSMLFMTLVILQLKEYLCTKLTLENGIYFCFPLFCNGSIIVFTISPV